MCFDGHFGFWTVGWSTHLLIFLSWQDHTMKLQLYIFGIALVLLCCIFCEGLWTTCLCPVFWKLLPMQKTIYSLRIFWEKVWAILVIRSREVSKKRMWSKPISGVVKYLFNILRASSAVLAFLTEISTWSDHSSFELFSSWYVFQFHLF